MRKLFISIFAMMAVCVFAQDVVPFTLLAPNTSATYAILMGTKKKLNMGICYYKISANNVANNEDGSKQLTYRIDILNKKKQISGFSNSIGTEDGFYFAVNLDNQGSFKMDQDIMWGIYPEMARGGYMFELPAQLTVGQILPSSTVKQQFRYTNKKMSSEFTYSNVKVEREEDKTTPAGTFHCYVISGTYSGTLDRWNVSAPFTMWIAPGVGIVSYETMFGGLRTFELSELSQN